MIDLSLLLLLFSVLTRNTRVVKLQNYQFIRII